MKGGEIKWNITLLKAENNVKTEVMIIERIQIIIELPHKRTLTMTRKKVKINNIIQIERD